MGNGGDAMSDRGDHPEGEREDGVLEGQIELPLEERVDPTVLDSPEAQALGEDLDALAYGSTRETADARLALSADLPRSVPVTDVDMILAENGTIDFEKALSHAASISTDVLYQAETIQPGFLLEFFANEVGSNTYVFAFRNNIEAEKTFGLNVFFRHRPEIRGLTSEAKDGKTEHGVREGYNGNFYDGDEYVEVMHNYTVTITKKVSEDDPELKAARAEHEKVMKQYDKVVRRKDKPRFKAFYRMLHDPKYDDIPIDPLEEGETLEDKLVHRIFEVSASSGVDPYLTMSLLKAENGDGEQFFGIKIPEVIGFEGQLDWAVKTIKKYELAFKSFFEGGPCRAGHYSVEFLAYFSERYSPLEQPDHFDNVYKNYFKYRGIPLLAKPDLNRRLSKGRTLAKNESAEYFHPRAMSDPFYHDRKTGRSWFLYHKGLKPVPIERIRTVLTGHPVDIGTIAPGNSGNTGGYRVRNRKKGGTWGHRGIDINGREGSNIHSWRDGEVIFADWKGPYGNLIIIDHKDGTHSWYAHLQNIPSKWKGASKKNRLPVRSSEVLAPMGDTGNSECPHLHFEIRIDGTPVNPLPFPELLEETPKVVFKVDSEGRSPMLCHSDETVSKARISEVLEEGPVTRETFERMVPKMGRVSDGFRVRGIHPYSKKPNRPHRGIDVTAPLGSPCYPYRPGTVVQSGWSKGYGWCVRIDHGGDVQSFYGHFASKPRVKVGDYVGLDTRIASIGSTGHSTGPHLHFEIRVDGGKRINPLPSRPLFLDEPDHTHDHGHDEDDHDHDYEAIEAAEGELLDLLGQTQEEPEDAGGELDFEA